MLSRNGIKTGNGNRWIRQKVTSLRSKNRILVHRPADDGFEAWLNLRHAARGTAEIALAVGAVLNTYKMKKHFDLTIADDAFGFARKTAEGAAEAATDGLLSCAPACPRRRLVTPIQYVATNP